MITPRLSSCFRPLHAAEVGDLPLHAADAGAELKNVLITNPDPWFLCFVCVWSAGG